MAGLTLGGAAVGVGGNALVNAFSGSRGINTGNIKDALQEGMAQLQAAIAAGRAAVGGAVKGMDRKIQKGVDELRDASDAETTQFWNSLGIFNEDLINSASALVDQFDGDVMQALETLEGTVTQLNEGYAQDMGAEIERYGSVADAINSKLAENENIASEAFLERVGQAQQTYRDETGAEIDAAKAEQMSLGDTFMQRSQDALSSYDQDRQATLADIRGSTQMVDSEAEARRSLNFNTENAAAFGNLADTLSKAAQQTRMDLLATADPRALELSAIADENAAAMMSGRISADMQANLSRSSAMRALSGGFGAGSDMGRGLSARDLGLTSLDLMQQGTQMYDAQRRLNYDTRVAGTQVDPFSVMQESGLSTTNALATATTNANRSLESAQIRANTSANMSGELLRGRLGTFESDRNQRIGAVQEASGQRLQTFDRLFGSNLQTADTLRGQYMQAAGQLSDNMRDDNIRSTGMRMGATQDIYNNTLGLADTIFNTGIGAAGQRFNTGLSMVGDIYKTNVGGAGQVYNTRTGIESNIFGGRTQSAIAGMQAQAAYETAAMQAQAGMISGNTATAANLPVIQAAQRQGGAMQSAQLWGAALQAGSSLAGSYLGSQNFSNMGSRSFGTAGPYTGSMSGITPASYRPVPLPT